MVLDLENFDEVKLKGEELYKSLTDVHCPFFNDKVCFNAQGLGHLKFKRHGHARPRQDQYMRFKLLHLAPVVLRNSKTLQGIWETKSFEKVRIHSRTDTVMKDVTYYEFVAVMENMRVKIIVKQTADGQRVFLEHHSILGYRQKDEEEKITQWLSCGRLSIKKTAEAVTLIGAWLQLTLSRERANPPNT